MRIATYNIEWFTGLFGRNNELLLNDAWSSRYNVTKEMQANAIATVLRNLDADAVMIIEAPDSSRNRNGQAALENFAAKFDLRTRSALLGFTNDTQQEIALLYDPDKCTVNHDPGSSDAAPQFDGAYEIDLDVDAQSDAVVWSKPPLEVSLQAAGFPSLHLIGVHAKSKAPHGAQDEADAMWISIENRRKQLAQCIWLRQRVTDRISAGYHTIVMGDFNDGPGLDRYEKLFGRSGVEIVLGADGDAPLFDPHAQMALNNRFAAPTTSRFWLSREKRFLQALLDYIMVSDGVAKTNPNWRIWHPYEDPCCGENSDLGQALLAASDHFPVTLDLDAVGFK